MLGPSISKVLWCLQLHISLLCVACTAININKHKDILYRKEAKVDGDNSYETRSKPNHTDILSRVNLALCMLVFTMFKHWITMNWKKDDHCVTGDGN